MLDVTVSEDSGFKRVALKGRMDGMSSPDLERRLEELIRGGERVLVVDLGAVSFISSAGLRVLLLAQKSLGKVHGEVLLSKVPDVVLGILRASGMLDYFRVFADEAAICAHAAKGTASLCIETIEADGVSFRWLDRGGAPGSLRVLGSLEPLALAAYTERDVVSVRAGELRFGAGLAAMGERYEEYRLVFGESVLVDGNFYCYPAVRHAAVDFMLATEQGAGLEYRFLHGFGFTGEYRGIAAFESAEGFVDLHRLIGLACDRVQANALGLVLLAESKGLWGMHMKRIPTAENTPGDGGEIFDASNFAAWMNFPVEPADADCIVMGAGIVIRDRELERSEVRRILPSGSGFHIHAAVFSREPLSKNPESFEAELKRAATELEVFKVQHLLGRSCFSRGMLGIIELRG